MDCYMHTLTVYSSCTCYERASRKKNARGGVGGSFISGAFVWCACAKSGSVTLTGFQPTISAFESNALTTQPTDLT